jgi:hypothetical protein
MHDEADVHELFSFDFAEGAPNNEPSVTFIPATISRDLEEELAAWELASDDDHADVIAYWLN